MSFWLLRTMSPDLTTSDVQWSEAISLTLPISYLALGIAQPRVATPSVHSQDPNHIAGG